MARKKKDPSEATANIFHTLAQTTDAQQVSQKLSELPDLKQHADAPKITGYMLLKPIGRGAYAEVWEAIQLRTRKFVAVKVFTKKSGIHWFYLQREADRLIRLDKHPHIVSLLDADLSGEIPYYVMDLAQEGSLERLMENGRAGKAGQETDEVADWMEEIAQALGYVHAKQMVHCDLKPANVLLDEENHVRVADFGNSRVLSESGGTLGTLFFMAPEQAMTPDPANPLQPDPRWDIYALGCTIYAVLAHRVPHVEITDKLEMAQGVDERLKIYREAIETQPIPNLFTLTKGMVDRDLSAIVAKCMESEPDKRYGSAAEILKDLKNRREGKPVSPLSDDMGYWLGKFLLRYRTSVLVICAALVAVSTALFFVSKHQAAQIQDTAFNYVLRGREFLEKGDEASATAYFAASNKMFPSLLARGNAVLHMPPIPKRFFAHDGAVVAVAYNPDGKILLTAGGTLGAKLWDAQTGQALSRPLKLEGALSAAAFSRDGSKLVLGDSEGDARIFDVTTQKAVGRPFEQKKEITSVSFSDDGQKVLTSSADGTAREWDAATGRSLATSMEHDRPLFLAAFNPNADRVLTVDKEGAVQLWQADNGNALGDSIKVDLQGAPAWYEPSVSFSPEGRGFLVTGWDGAVKFYDNKGRRSGHPLFLDGLGARAVYSPDGKRVLTSVVFGGAVGMARVWGAKSHLPLKFSLKTPGKIMVLAFNSDGSEVLTGDTDHVVRVWDAQTGELLGHAFWQGDMITAAAFQPGGESLATGSKDGLACLWKRAGDEEDPVSLEWEKSDREHFKKLQDHSLFSPDLREVLTYGGKTACLWDTATGNPVGKALIAGGTILRAVFNPEGSSLLTCEKDGEARLWNLATDKFMVLSHEKAVHGGAFSADGKKILTGGEDKNLRLWNASNGEEIRKSVPTGLSITKALLSPDGEKMAVLGLNGGFKLYPASKGDGEVWPLLKIDKGVKNAVFSGNSRTLLLFTGSTATLYDAKTGKALLNLKHGLGLSGVLLSPDNQTAATLGADGNIRLWNLITGLPIGNSLKHEGAIQDCVFSPHGEALFAAYQDGGWQWWDTQTGEAIGEEVMEGTQVRAMGFDPGGKSLQLLGKDGTLTKIDADWVDPQADPDQLLLASQVAGRCEVNSQGSLDPVPADQWVRLWVQYQKDKN
jgi:WD40 repeat protein